MSVEIRDILLKAAEDVQSGMWCKGEWYAGLSQEEFQPWNIDLETALATQRCAEGSIGVAILLLGAGEGEFLDTQAAINRHLSEGNSCTIACLNYENPLVHLNDRHLPDDPFEAGQQLAELFRQTAESL